LFASEPFAVFSRREECQGGGLSLLADLPQGACCGSEHDRVKTFVDSGDPMSTPDYSAFAQTSRHARRNACRSLARQQSKSGINPLRSYDVHTHLPVFFNVSARDCHCLIDEQIIMA